jgi:hypothetical protein
VSASRHLLVRPRTNTDASTSTKVQNIDAREQPTAAQRTGGVEAGWGEESAGAEQAAGRGQTHAEIHDKPSRPPAPSAAATVTAVPSSVEPGGGGMPRAGGRSHTPPPAQPAPPAAAAAAAAAPSSRHPAKEGRILRPLLPLNKAVAVAVERAPSAVGAPAHARTSGGGLANTNTSGAPEQQGRAPSAAAHQPVAHVSHAAHTTQEGGVSVRGEHSVSVGPETTATAASGGGGGGGLSGSMVGGSTASTAGVPHATPTVKELFEQRAEARTAAAAAQLSALSAAAAERSLLTADIASADSNSLHASTTTPHPPATLSRLASGAKTRPGQTMHIATERDTGAATQAQAQIQTRQ